MKTNKKVVLIASTLIVGITASIFGITTFKETKPDFPVYKLSPYADYSDCRFESLVKDADLVIVGQVSEVIGTTTVNNTPVPGSSGAVMEELDRAKGIPPPPITRHTTKIKILETIVGSNEQEEFFLNRALMNIGYSPDLKKGDKMLFFLHKAKHEENTYLGIHPHASYFNLYKNKVYAVYQYPEYKQFEDMDLDTFKEKVKKLKKEKDQEAKQKEKKQQ